MATNDKLIQVRNLEKHYNRGAIKALDGVSVDIYKGDVMVVIGPSGSGKSTFLRCLNLLEEPTSGEVWFEGDISYDTSSRDPEKFDPYWMGSTVSIENGFVYLIDDEDVSVNDINSSYCWFKARTMKYRVIPN